MAHTILEMTIDDYDEVVALWECCKGLGEAESRSEIEAFLDRNPGFSFVARDDSELVGATLCGHDARRGYIYHLAVRDTHRQQGIGKALADACLDKLAKIGIRRCSIHLYAENDSGEEFWKRTGWRVRTDLKVMARDLPVADA